MSSTEMVGAYRDSLLTRAEAAALVGVTPATWSGYVSRGFAPAPAEVVGRTPLWDPVVVRRWHQSRPGAGRPPKGTLPPSARRPEWPGPVRRLLLAPGEAAALLGLLDDHLATGCGVDPAGREEDLMRVRDQLRRGSTAQR